MVPGSDGPIPCRPALAHLRASFAPWTPERVGAVTGIEADKIREAAHMLSDSGSVAYYCWSGVGQHRDATQIDGAIALLTVLKGRHDAPGGRVAVELLQPALSDLLGVDHTRRELLRHGR